MASGKESSVPWFRSAEFDKKRKEFAMATETISKERTIGEVVREHPETVRWLMG